MKCRCGRDLTGIILPYHCACGQDTYEDRVEEHGPLPPPVEEEFPNKDLPNMRAAILSWRSMGSPVRTEEEIERIRSRGCAPCPFYDAGKDTCQHLGCCVGAKVNRAILRHKRKMGTEACPIGEWHGLSGQVVIRKEVGDDDDDGEAAADGGDANLA